MNQFSQNDDLETLEEDVRDAIRCHFENEEGRPRFVRLHFTREQVIAV